MSRRRMSLRGGFIAARPNAASAWNGLCPAGKHGLDFEGQDCDVCAHERGGPCGRDCRRCHAERRRSYSKE